MPLASVAVHVLVIVKLFTQLPGVIASVYVKVGEPGQLSVEVGVPVFAGKELALHEILIDGGTVIDGCTVSPIVTLVVNVA